MLAQLNYHHLYYFWAVAKEGHLTRAARLLSISQSALSTQIRHLETQLGQPLFDRVGRRLQLTEAGHVTLGYAEAVFAAGGELLATLRDGAAAHRQRVRIGAVSTLSRNFQENFIRPLLTRPDVEMALHAGTLAELLVQLRVHALDVILSNQRVYANAHDPWRCRRIARQPVSVVGPRRKKSDPFRFPDGLASVPLLLPGRTHDIRTGFDLFCEQHGIRYQLRAEVDDMALLRLLARDSDSAALLPTVVVQDELRTGRLVEYAVIPDLYEDFYAISVRRQFVPPILRELLLRSPSEVLGASP